MLTSPLVVQAIESGVGSASAASSSSGGGSGSASMKILGQMARTSGKSSSSSSGGSSHGGKVRVRAVADRIFMRLAANLKMDSARMLGYFLRKAWRRVS